MSRLQSRGSFNSLTDPKQMFFSAARHARRASALARNSSSTEASSQAAQGLPPSDEESGGMNYDVAVLPTLEENRRSQLSEMDNFVPFSGAEEKMSSPEDDDEARVYRMSSAASMRKGDDGDMRVTRTPSVARMCARIQNLPVTPTEKDTDDEFTSSLRPRSTAVSEASFRIGGGAFGHSLRPGSPQDSTLSKGGKGTGRWNTNSLSSSDGHRQSSILRYIRKASRTLSNNPFGSSSHGAGAPGAPTSLHHSSHAHGPVKLAARGKLTEEDEAMLSDSEADYDAFDSTSEGARKKLLSPNLKFLRWYATYMLVALLVFVCYMPVRVGFFQREKGAWSKIDFVWNILFIVDMILHLNTGFVNSDTGMVRYSRREIFWRYAKGWLIVDLLAAFPFTFLPGLGPDDAEGYHEIAYFLSLPKILRLYGLLTMAQENHRLHEGSFLAVRTLLSVIMTAHLFGCGWYMLARLNHKECEDLYRSGLPEGETIPANGIDYSADDYIQSECPWIYRNDYDYLPLGRRYLGSVYWSLTTLTTVGYGDLSARTVDEQIYSMAVQIVGVAWYGYIVGTWAAVLNSFDSEVQKQRSKMREVVAFSKAAGLPPKTAKQVRQHFRFALYRKDNWISFNENEIVSDMPAELRADVVTYVQRNTIAQIPWFDGKEATFVADIVVLLKPRLFKMGDALFREGTQPEELFFITSGRVLLKYKDTLVGHLKVGQMAGLIGLVSCENHKLTALAAQKEAHCLGLSRVHFLEMMDNYPREMGELVQASKALLRRISAGSSEAKTDFSLNPVLATLIGSSSIPSPHHASFFEPYGAADRWTQLSYGRDVPQERGALPAAWGAQVLQSAQYQTGAKTQNGQDNQTSSEDDVPPVPASGPGDDSSSVALSISRTSTSVAVSAGVAGGSGGDGRGNGGEAYAAARAAEVEDAVSREVSRRMAGMEAMLSVMMQRLDGVMGVEGVKADLAAAAAAAESAACSPSEDEEEEEEGEERPDGVEGAESFNGDPTAAAEAGELATSSTSDGGEEEERFDSGGRGCRG